MDVQLINSENLSLSPGQLLQSMPYFIVLIGAMIALLFGVSRRFADQYMSKMMTIGALAVAMYSVAMTWGEPNTVLFNKMLAADSFSHYFNVLFIFITGYICISSFSYVVKHDIQHPEYFSLVLFACLGMMLLANSLDLVVLFIALEIMSIAIYVLVGFKRNDVRSNEAALKYFVLGSAASAVLLYGIALLYGATGSMHIHEIAIAIRSQTTGGNTLMMAGLVLVLFGFLFKIAAVPFHMWMPDVYEGAPVVITSFMTTGLKAAAFASFLRVFSAFGYLDGNQMFGGSTFYKVLWLIAVLTMFAGNAIALTQTSIKRMLAYSSIAHTGYILVGMIAGAKTGLYAPVITYVTAYAIANLGAFGIITYLSEKGDAALDIADLSGLGFKRPVLAFALMVFMFSMAGVPPAAGFIAKYLMFSASVQAGDIWIVVLGVLSSAIGAYYYLRIIVVMYMKEPVHEFSVQKGAFVSASLAGVATALTLQLGLMPSQLISIAERAAAAIMGR